MRGPSSSEGPPRPSAAERVGVPRVNVGLRREIVPEELDLTKALQRTQEESSREAEFGHGEETWDAASYAQKTKHELAWEKDISDYMQLLQLRQREILEKHAHVLGKHFSASDALKFYRPGHPVVRVETEEREARIKMEEQLTADDLYGSRSEAVAHAIKSSASSGAGMIAPLLRVLASRFAIGYVTIHYRHLRVQLERHSRLPLARNRFVAAIYTVLRVCKHARKLSLAAVLGADENTLEKMKRGDDRETQMVRIGDGSNPMICDADGIAFPEDGLRLDHEGEVIGVKHGTAAERRGVAIGDRFLCAHAVTPLARLRRSSGQTQHQAHHAGRPQEPGAGMLALTVARSDLQYEPKAMDKVRSVKDAFSKKLYEVFAARKAAQAEQAARETDVQPGEQQPSPRLTASEKNFRQMHLEFEKSGEDALVHGQLPHVEIDSLESLGALVNEELQQARESFMVKSLDWEYLSPLEKEIPAFQALKKEWEARMLEEQQARQAERKERRARCKAGLERCEAQGGFGMGRLLGHVEQDLDAKKGRYEQKLQELDEESRVSAEDGPFVSELDHTAGGIAAEEVGVELVYGNSHTIGGERAVFQVILDHFSNAMVVAFRGTANGKDAISDLAIAPEKLYADSPDDEYCDSSFLRCARYALDCLERLGFLRHLPSSYSVVPCGHSLGGGCAACLGFLLDKRYPELRREHRLRVLCVAPPGLTCSQTLREQSLEYMLTIVMGADAVPRGRPLSGIARFSKHDLIYGKLQNMRERLWDFWHAMNMKGPDG
eukprot:g8706.t1